MSRGRYLIDLIVLGADVGEVHAVKIARIDLIFRPPNGVLAPNHVTAVKPPLALLRVDLLPALLLQTGVLERKRQGGVRASLPCRLYHSCNACSMHPSLQAGSNICGTVGLNMQLTKNVQAVRRVDPSLIDARTPSCRRGSSRNFKRFLSEAVAPLMFTAVQ